MELLAAPPVAPQDFIYSSLGAGRWRLLQCCCKRRVARVSCSSARVETQKLGVGGTTGGDRLRSGASVVGRPSDGLSEALREVSAPDIDPVRPYVADEVPFQQG